MAERSKNVVDENAVKVTTVFTNIHEHAVLDADATLDDQALAALGYKQEFKRFGLARAGLLRTISNLS